ncbi:MAG: hypothetical protein ACREU6_18620 [Steroidobacteraceae bacterium]
MRSPVTPGCIALALLLAGCANAPDQRLQRRALLRSDDGWWKSVGDSDINMTYYAKDAVLLPQGKPAARGVGEIRQLLMQMHSAAGFKLTSKADQAEVGTAGDIGYTAGTYAESMNGSTHQGKYVAIWRRDTDTNQWKVVEGIFNSNGSPETTAAPAKPLTFTPAAVVWSAVPGLPPGAKRALLVGDPSKAGPYVARVQLPAGYRLAPHWHSNSESITILSGVLSFGVGDTFDEATMKDLPAGSFYFVPPNTHQYLMAKTAVTGQMQGIGPVSHIVFVNPSDDPRNQAK